jgi:hypothetical protein
MTEPKTIEHDPDEAPRTDWRKYRQWTLSSLHANHARFAAQEGDKYKDATLRLAQALQPGFVVWCAAEFGQHETPKEVAFVAFSRAMPWLFYHLGELLQGSNGPAVMARAIYEATGTELEGTIVAMDEPDDAPMPATAGTA